MSVATTQAGEVEARERSRKRARGREQLRPNAWRLAVLVVFAGAWESATRTGAINPFWVSSPSLIVLDLWKSVASGSVFLHIAITLYEAFLGFATGAVVGIGSGFALARWDPLARVLDPYVTALNSLPRVALAPLFILWFGIGVTSKVILAFSLVVFILLVNTYAGAKNVDQDLVIISRLLGATRRQLTVKVILPSSIPWIFAGLRLGLAYALIGAVVGEVIVAQAGISGSTVLGDFVAVGGQAGLACHLRVGAGARIAGAASVKDNIPAGARYVGMPAKPVRLWAREQAALQPNLGAAAATNGRPIYHSQALAGQPRPGLTRGVELARSRVACWGRRRGKLTASVPDRGCLAGEYECRSESHRRQQRDPIEDGRGQRDLGRHAHLQEQH